MPLKLMKPVSIIVATYNWPCALVLSLESVLFQSYSNWRAIVIGDCCGEETGHRLKRFSDPRIRYVNLPSRSGEQSGPNSVGMALAETDYIAFLNHDDIWLPDHLELGIRALESSGADLFTGQAAFAVNDPNDRQHILFESVSPVCRSLGAAFSSAYYLFEPMSAWIMTRDAARRIGRFNSAVSLFRTPLEDWLLRALRKGLTHVEGAEVTILKNNAKAGVGKFVYDRHPAVLVEWLEQLRSASTESLRERVKQDVASARLRNLERDYTRPVGPSDFANLAAKILTPTALEIFQRTGWDAMNNVCSAARLERGWIFRGLSQRRVGEEMPDPPDFQLILDSARAQLHDA